jgi:DedD protein
MADQGFHEIQLSGKQLIFLFMCAVVATVVVFLFGVSVGRGVRPAAVETAEAAPAMTTPAPDARPAQTPPPTQTSSKDLTFGDSLAQQDLAKVPPPAPPAEEPVGDSQKKSAASPRVEPKAPVAKPAEPPAAAVTATPPPAVASPPAPKTVVKSSPPLNGFVVQVEAFNSNETASSEVAKLQAKGYPAFVFTEAANVPGPRYKVRVGPYSARAEADQILKNLTSQGYKPLIKR